MSAYTSLKFLLFTARKPGHFAAVNLTLLVVKVVAGLILIPSFGPSGAAWSVVAAYTASTCVIVVLVRGLRPALAGRQACPCPVNSWCLAPAIQGTAGGGRSRSGVR